MSISAVPQYLQETDPEFYLTAPPGHRFLLYFAAWGENQETGGIDWRMKDRVPKMKRQRGQLIQQGWDDVPNERYACAISACETPAYNEEGPRARRPKTDPGLKPWKALMEGLLVRQAAAAAQISAQALLRLDALATAPFTTGLGNEHPLENGFSFLNPYGLPYLPGSGVKGVLRQAARELVSGDWGEKRGWSEDKPYTLMRGEGEERKPVVDEQTKAPVELSMLDVLFGPESDDGDRTHVRGALSFWDVVPQIKGDSLMVEIMTPHQGHYYQWKKDAGGNPMEVAPHDSGLPNPISFLTVPPGSTFTFIVTCDTAHLRRLAGKLVETDSGSGKPRWHVLLTAAFEHAFQWLGFGAKTAVGYGAMREDEGAKERQAEREREAAERLSRERAAREREAALAQMAPAERAIREFLDARPDKNQAELSALLGAIKQGRWDGEAKLEAARYAEKLMREAKKWKEKSEKKKPEKDHDYQNTLKIIEWLKGK